MVEICSEPVSSVGFPGSLPCVREAKTRCDDGKLRCGRCAGNYKRRKTGGKKRERERAASESNRERAQSAALLLGQLGITASPHYHWEQARYSGNIIIDPAELLPLLGLAATLPEKQKTVR